MSSKTTVLFSTQLEKSELESFFVCPALVALPLASYFPAP